MGEFVTEEVVSLSQDLWGSPPHDTLVSSMFLMHIVSV